MNGVVFQVGVFLYESQSENTDTCHNPRSDFGTCASSILCCYFIC